jgi:aspartate racemase
MKKLGIIGGLGPMATAYFMELVIKMTKAGKDQDHIKMFLYSIPDAPDRTAYICGKSKKSPLPHMIKAGRSLIDQKADFLAIPCVTAQYFYNSLTEELKVPVIPLVANIAREIKQKGIKAVGILATQGTIESQVLQKEFMECGIEVILPSKEGQAAVMDVIYNQIKAGKPVDLNEFTDVGNELIDKGAERLIIGCTELSLIKKEYPLERVYVDILEVLAKNVVEYSGAPLRMEYSDIV